MELRTVTASAAVRVRPVMACAQCGEALYMAAWSEHVDERRVRHLWECDACGYEFETLACFPTA
jgi:hypothetical protein